MGNVFYRNRFWVYRSLYDDYCLREIRMSYVFSGLIYIPFYLWGVHINREVEVYNSHIIYTNEYGPRRSRLHEALMYEKLEMMIEQYKRLQPQIDEQYQLEYAELGDADMDMGDEDADADEDEDDEDEDDD